MLYIDLIVPYFSHLYKYFDIPSGTNVRYQYWFPIWYFKKDLKKRGLKVRFLNLYDLKFKKLSNIIGLDSSTSYLSENIGVLGKKLKKKANFLIWFDQGDNPGKTFFTSLRYVDRYLKRQIYKDFSLYRKEFYRSRYHVDFYVRNYNLSKKNIRMSGDYLKPEYENKIGLSWNFAYCDYRFSNILSQYIYKFTRKPQLKFLEPNSNKRLLFSANFNIHGDSRGIYSQRILLKKFLMKKYGTFNNVSIGNVPKKTYINNINNSKAIFSPFGWGEGCFRDFEAFIAGAALIKPNMDYLDTWPDIYKKNDTYIPLSWKIEEWDKETDMIFDDEQNFLKIAKKSQNAYKKLWTNEGKDSFCKRFIEMVSPI